MRKNRLLSLLTAFMLMLSLTGTGFTITARADDNSSAIKILTGNVILSTGTIPMTVKNNLLTVDLSGQPENAVILSVSGTVSKDCTLSVDGATKTNKLVKDQSKTILIPDGFVNLQQYNGISMKKLRELSGGAIYTVTGKMTDSKDKKVVNYTVKVITNVNLIDEKTPGGAVTIPKAGIVTIPTKVDFGTITAKKLSAKKTITIKNTSSSTVKISKLVLSGKNKTEFKLDKANVKLSLAKNRTTTVKVLFNPASKGNKAAVLEITTTNGLKVSVKLIGKGK